MARRLELERVMAAASFGHHSAGPRTVDGLLTLREEVTRLNLIVQSPAPSPTKSAAELDERAAIIHAATTLRRQLQQAEAANAGLQIENAGLRSESTASASLEIITTPTPTPTSSSSKRKERRIPNAEVAIHNLTFREGAKVMLSPDIQNLFVTYTFLGVPNDLLETPESKRKPGRPALVRKHAYARTAMPSK